MPAVMWKRDDFAHHQMRMRGSQVMHRQAMDRGWYTNVKRSSIDKRYYAEIDQYIKNEDGTYKHSVFNVKLGTGDSPIEAAADGYRQVMPDDLVMRGHCALAVAEVLVEAAQARAATLRKLDNTLDGLTDLVRSFNVPRPADPGEDDDL